MATVEIRYVFILCALVLAMTVESNDSKPETLPGRKYISQDYDERYVDFGPHKAGRANKNYVMPYRHKAGGVLKQSGTNVNWSVWKDEEDSGQDDTSKEDSGKWPPSWNVDPWLADPMYLMMMKNVMSDMKGDNKPSGFFSKLSNDPAALLIAAAIPISLILAAVIPTLMSMMMSGGPVPVISTTATGPGRARSGNDIEMMPFFGPVMDAIGNFGAKTLVNPECTQRIFCQVIQNKLQLGQHNYLQKAVSIASVLVDPEWLENYGVADLVDSIGHGKCENIPCKTDNQNVNEVKN